MPLFDAYIFIDWSAANRATPRNPCADSVWMGQLVRHLSQEETYHRTRTDCISRLLPLLLNHVAMGHRVLVGFDFPYGYPGGFCHALGLPSGPHEWLGVWTELASRVTDCADNENNRFVVASTLNAIAGNGRCGPFWGVSSKNHIFEPPKLLTWISFCCFERGIFGTASPGGTEVIGHT